MLSGHQRAKRVNSVLRYTLCLTLGFGLAVGAQRLSTHADRKGKQLGAPPLDKLLYERRVSQFASIDSKAKLVMLGDSRMQEGEWAELLGETEIANRGINGDTTSGVLRRLRESVPTTVEVCIIQIGVNDLLQRNPIDDVLQNYRSIVSELTMGHLNLTVIVTATIVTSGERPELNLQIAELNSRLERLTHELKVAWIDPNPQLAPQGILDQQLTNDGTHLNGDAYKIFANVLQPQLKALSHRIPK